MDQFKKQIPEDIVFMNLIRIYLFKHPVIYGENIVSLHIHHNRIRSFHALIRRDFHFPVEILATVLVTVEDFMGILSHR
jgi:hypothetical protein